ncbi:MAG: prolipoprotein diacylglyceryl transferase [Acidimicrobiia bacterium]
MDLIASIPSPSSNRIGPFHAYGLMIALGVVVAYFIADRRWRRMGGRDETFGDMAVWIVVWGVIGSRIYHVVSDIQLYNGRGFDGVIDAFKIWDGGLGSWGWLLAGAITIIVLAHRRGLDALRMMDAVAPGVFVAQAIGRWGNWFNQELFGRPTDLPWGLEIDEFHRPAGFQDHATFHPTFLYEALWNLIIVGFVIWAERRFRFRRGQSAAALLALYTAGRFVWENLRIDPANEFFGLRLSALVSMGAFVFALAWFVWLGRRDVEPPPLEQGLPPARDFDDPAPLSRRSRDQQDLEEATSPEGSDDIDDVTSDQQAPGPDR